VTTSWSIPSSPPGGLRVEKCAGRSFFVSGLQHGGPVGGEDQGRGVGFSDRHGHKPALVMAIHIDSVNTRQGTPTKKQRGLADDEIRATGGEFDSRELGVGGFIK